MLSHVTIGVADVARARDFYGPLLALLGLVPKFADARWAGWRSAAAERPLFILTLPYDGQAAVAGNGPMIAFSAEDRGTVDRCHALAIASGGRDAGGPALRPHYHPDYYGAYFHDPDGNKICICCHRAA